MGLFGPPDIKKMEAKGNIKGLMRVLRSNEPRHIREEAMNALVGIKDARVLDALIELIRQPEPFIYGTAIQALGQMRDARAVDKLLGLLQQPERHMYAPAVRALGQSGDLRAFEAILEMLGDRDWWLRSESMTALGVLGDRRAIGPLIEALRGYVHEVNGASETGDKNAVGNAAIVLDKLGWLPGPDEDGAWYWAARQDWDQCSAIGTPAIPALISGIWTGSPKITEALVKMGTPAVEGLIAYVTDQSYEFFRRCHAARTLMNFYQSGRLEITSKQRILSMRESMRHLHMDKPGSSDCHGDIGIRPKELERLA